MALKYNKQKNLIRSPDEYTKYYGNFRGVDFSSDHTEVHDQRLAYSINMYKDYRTGEGNAIETIPGYRRRFMAPRGNDKGKYTYERINGIHEFSYVTPSGTRDKDILVHAGNHLYLWDNYPYSVNVELKKSMMIPLVGIPLTNINFETIESVFVDGEEYTSGFSYSRSPAELFLDDSFGDFRTKTIKIKYYANDQLKETYIGTDKYANLSIAMEIEDVCSAVRCVYIAGAGELVRDVSYNAETKILTLDGVFWNYRGHACTVKYYEKQQTEADALSDGMADAESKSFVFNNRLYIIDGENYRVFYKDSDHVLKSVSDECYVPTTYRNIGVGDSAPTDIAKHEYEQKNLLSSKYKHTYIAGVVKEIVTEGEGDSAVTTTKITPVATYPLYDEDYSTDKDYSTISVKVYDTDLIQDQDYKVENGAITFTTAPQLPEDKGYPETYAGIEVTFIKKKTTCDEDAQMINKCTVVATFDKRVFLTGNPKYPNRIWYCGYNNAAGYEDATYFGENDYVTDGVENAPVTGLIPVADTLAAIKNHTRQDGSVYFHTRLETDDSRIPVTYPSEPGLSGIGCLGACVNFLDDPIFISRLGVEAIGQLSVRLERAIEHRSSLIDAKLVNLNLNHARFTEWDGYLIVLVEGKIFMADSRQKYTYDTGVPQYEWYYLEDIGIYEDTYPEYYYCPVMYDYIPKTVVLSEKNEDGQETYNTYEVDLATHIYNPDFMTSENRLYTAVRVDEDDIVNDQPNVQAVEVEYDGYKYGAYFVIKRTWDGQSYNSNGERIIVNKAILCEDYGSVTGGTFYPAKKIVTIEENVNTTASVTENVSSNIASNIFFGTDNGVVCSFNFDMKDKEGFISPQYYSFDNRTIYSGIATKMDNCGIPHLTKSTIKKSTVIKTKSMAASAAKVRVRTNNKGYESVARVNSKIFSFEDVDFSDFTFVSQDQTIFAVKEKEKHWVEKQHWIYSDEYQRPFSVHYVAFRYKVSGRIKE